MQDVVLARFLGREEANKLSFDQHNVTRIATAVSEITRNVIQHSGAEGEMTIHLVHEGDKKGLQFIVSDQGKGISNLTAATRETGATLISLGAGLIGSRKLMDYFHIQSSPGQGTTVTMIKWVNQ